MKKITKSSILSLTFIFSLILSLGQAQDMPATVVDIAVGSEAHTTLVAAVVEAGLAETLSSEGPFTVFAPTDDAFAAALEALGISAADLLASEDLTSILTYHVVAGKLMAADVIAAVEAGEGTAMVETVNGASVTVTIEDGMVVLDGSAKVAVADLAAGNGVVHVIDAVILPPSNDMMENDMMEESMDMMPATVVDIALSSDVHTTLVEAVIAADLAETLSGEGPFTVFAPTNEAFGAALTALGISAGDLLASDGLAGILTYHVVAGNLMAADVVAAVEAGEGTAMVETVNGASVTVTIEDGMVVLDGSAKVAVADLAAGNGVVHVIDGVILPPSN